MSYPLLEIGPALIGVGHSDCDGFFGHRWEVRINKPVLYPFVQFHEYFCQRCLAYRLVARSTEQPSLSPVLLIARKKIPNA